MKKIFFFIILIVISITSCGTDYTSIQTGNWVTPSTWDATGVPDGSKENTITISSGTVVTANNLSFAKATEIIIEDGAELIINTLDVTIDAAEARKDFIFTVMTGGILTINGDFTAAKDALIDISGTATITGDLALTLPATINVDGFLEVDGVIDPTPTITGGGMIDEGGTIIYGGALPIELLFFSGSAYPNHNLLLWSTASETNNDYFKVEYSTDAKRWEHLETINGAGNSSLPIDYEFVHNTNRSYYYKITQYDYNGANESFDLIYIEQQIHPDEEYDLYDMMGRYIKRVKGVEINNLSSGQYILYHNGISKKIIK